MGNIYRVCPRLWFTDCVSLSFGKEQDRQGIRWGKDLLLMTPILWYNCVFSGGKHIKYSGTFSMEFLFFSSFFFFYFFILLFVFLNTNCAYEIGKIHRCFIGEKKKTQLYPYIRVQHIFWSCCAFLQSLFFFFFQRTHGLSFINLSVLGKKIKQICL